LIDARRPGNSDKVPGVGRDVDSADFQDFQGYDIQGSFVGGGENHRCGGTILMGLQPANGDNAPPVSG
jgi:hypothetical protein